MLIAFNCDYDNVDDNFIHVVELLVDEGDVDGNGKVEIDDDDNDDHKWGQNTEFDVDDDVVENDIDDYDHVGDHVHDGGVKGDAIADARAAVSAAAGAAVEDYVDVGENIQSHEKNSTKAVERCCANFLQILLQRFGFFKIGVPESLNNYRSNCSVPMAFSQVRPTPSPMSGTDSMLTQ